MYNENSSYYLQLASLAFSEIYAQETDQLFSVYVDTEKKEELKESLRLDIIEEPSFQLLIPIHSPQFLDQPKIFNHNPLQEKKQTSLLSSFFFLFS